MSPTQRAVVPFQVTSKDSSISYRTHEVALSCRCTWAAHLRATGWSMPHQTERHLCKGTQNHLPPSLAFPFSPLLLPLSHSFLPSLHYPHYIFKFCFVHHCIAATGSYLYFPSYTQLGPHFFHSCQATGMSQEQGFHLSGDKNQPNK